MIGLLFGSQNGLDVSIYDAMEVACTAVGADGLELNEALVEKQKDLCELPPHWECVAGDLRASAPLPRAPNPRKLVDKAKMNIGNSTFDLP